MKHCRGSCKQALLVTHMHDCVARLYVLLCSEAPGGGAIRSCRHHGYAYCHLSAASQVLVVHAWLMPIRSRTAWCAG